MLLVIACWKDILSIVDLAPRHTSVRTGPLRPVEVQASIKARCSRGVSRQVGQIWTDIILAGLDFEDPTHLLDEYGTHRYYGTDVIEPMGKDCRFSLSGMCRTIELDVVHDLYEEQEQKRIGQIEKQQH